MSCERLSLCNGIRPDLQMASRSCYSEESSQTGFFLQPAQCAYADDLAVAAPSFRNLMTAVAPAFQSVDNIAGLNLNYQKMLLGPVWYGGT